MTSYYSFPIAPSVSCSCLDALNTPSSKLPLSPAVSRCLPLSATRLSLLLNPHPKLSETACASVLAALRKGQGGALLTAEGDTMVNWVDRHTPAEAQALLEDARAVPPAAAAKGQHRGRSES